MKDSLKVTFLGTGTSQGVPVVCCDCEVCTSSDPRDERLRVSIHIGIDEKSFLIDTGPDFRQQMLREKISHLDAILFTHEHKDHTAGLDDVRAFNFKSKKKMPIYATARVIDALKQSFAYIFATNKYPGIPRLEVFEIENCKFTIEGVDFQPIEVMHYKLPVLGFRIRDFTYITDANYISEKELEKIRGSTTIVLNALQKTKHISHFSLQQAVDILHELKPQRAYLTHISHKLGKHEDIERELPEFIRLAYDGLRIEI